MKRKNSWREFSRRHFMVLTLVFLVGCAGMAGLQTGSGDAKQPKNIIILFADGVAASQLEAARYASHHVRNQPFTLTDTFLKEGNMALLTNYAHDAFIPDSAAAGTAMSIGAKTTLGSIGVTPDGQPLKTIMEAAKAKKKRIGLVSTASVYDATPASFSVHAKVRGDSQSLVDQYLTMEPDVLLGAGYDYFLPEGKEGGKRKDGKDIVAAFRAKGYEVARNARELKAVKGPRVLGLFAADDMTHEIDRHTTQEPSVAEMAEAAIRILSQGSPNGFVLLVETENTDRAGHRNDIASLIKDLWVFDRAVQIALEYQRKTPAETLMIVTGDHETGGLSATYALKDLSSTSSKNRFYSGPQHFKMIDRINISLEKAAETLGKKPTPAAVDKLVEDHFPGFKLDSDLRTAIVKQEVLERNFTYPTQCALGRMVSRQTGFYWGTAGHTNEPVVAGALGPGAGRFKGYMDNTNFGKIIHGLLEGQ